MRTPSAKTKSHQFDRVITDTLKLWRRHHLTYDQTRYVAKEVWHALAIARPPTRHCVIARLSEAEEARLLAQAYRMPGVRGLLRVKSEGPYLARLEPISAVLLPISRKQSRPMAEPLQFSRHEV